MLPLSRTGLSPTNCTISPNAANESSQPMRMFARLWVWLADITRFNSSALQASARCAPLRLGIRAT
ncbi:hypothetical protein D3C76_1282320 [compost metagenome]